MTKKLIVYYNGGDNYAGQFDNTAAERWQWKAWAKENNQTGYISGYRYLDTESQSVMVFCQDNPGIVDIESRRINGLHNAKWNYINR